MPLNATHDGVDVAILFYIMGGNDAGIFTLGICNGQVRVLRSGLMNYHVRKTYVLDVQARANGLVTSAANANITITVINVPHVPVLNTTSCVQNVDEFSECEFGC